MLLQTGGARVESGTGMLTTVAWLRDGALSYALEGAIFVTGATLQWLRDELGIIKEAAEAGPLASRSRMPAGSSWCPPSPASARRIGTPTPGARSSA